MKPTVLVLLTSLVLGSVAGLGVAYLKIDPGRPRFAFSKPMPTLESTGVPPIAAARVQAVIMGDSTFDFGVMSRNERRSHTFVVANKGTAPLHIGFTDKSCQCTDVSMSRTEVPPGEQMEIELTWQPSTFKLSFEQSARFRTNDPGRIELDLTVKGRVQQIVQVTPCAVNFDNLQSGLGREAICRLFAYRDSDVSIDRVELLDPEIAEYFDVQVEPLTDAVLADETGAVGGQQLRVTVKAGLPVGPFQQRLRIYLNQPELGTREIPIIGSVVGDVGIVGPGFSRSTNTWELGMLPGDQEHERRIWLLVRGKSEKPVEMKVVSVDPDGVLQANIEPPTSPNLAKFTLHLRVRPQENVINRRGNRRGKLGEIVIKTSLRESPEIRIPVAFGIESNLGQ